MHTNIMDAKIECRCCFDSIELSQMTYCDDLHMFCFDCANSNAKVQLESMNTVFKCMDSSGCNNVFDQSQSMRFLSAELIELMNRTIENVNIRSAITDNLYYCPFCGIAAVYENIDDNTKFICYNNSCNKTSCMECKKEHMGSCKGKNEFQDSKEKERINREERESSKIITKCPKCNISLFKDGGCNHITCTKCGAHACYICKKDISDTLYEHFAHRNTNSTCQMFEDIKLESVYTVPITTVDLEPNGRNYIPTRQSTRTNISNSKSTTKYGEGHKCKSMHLYEESEDELDSNLKYAKFDKYNYSTPKKFKYSKFNRKH